MCRFEATAIREFGDYLIRVECKQHNNDVMDSVVPQAEVNDFLFTGKSLSDAGLLNPAMFHAVVSALDLAGADVARYRSN